MHEVREVVGRYAGGFDAAVVSTADAQRIVVDATAAANMLATVVALAAKRVADTEGWRSCGDASAAHHLARTSGSSVARAKAVLDTAGRLGALPALEAAARGGELSPAQVAPIADAASKAPGAEARLVASAKAVSLGELFDACARTKAAAEPDDGARHRAIHAGRFLRRRRTTDGAGELQYRSSLEEVAEIFAVVQGWSQRRFAAARAAGTRAAGEVYLADGLLDAVRASCAPMSSHRTDRVVVSGETAGGGGSAAGADRSASRSGSSGAGARPAGATGAGANGAGANGAAAGGAGVSGETPGGSRSGGYPTDAGAATAVMDRRGVGDLPSLFAHEPFPDVPAVGTPHDTGPPKPPSPAKVIVRVDWDALVRGWPVDGEVCEINGLGPVAVSAVRGMIASGDAFLAAVVTKGVDVVNVAHLGRRASAFQRSGLEWLSPECVTLGCNAKAHLEIDHRVAWAESKITLLALLERHCSHHHDKKTYDGWALVEGAGKRPMVPPEDPRHPRHAGSTSTAQ